MTTGLWYEDPDESADDVATQLKEARESLTPEQRKDLAAFLVDGDEPAKDDASAQERWQRNAQQRNAATPEATSDQPAPRGPSGGDDLDGEIAAEAARLKASPGDSWAHWLSLKQERAMRQQQAG